VTGDPKGPDPGDVEMDKAAERRLLNAEEDAHLLKWEAHETIGLGITNVGKVARVEITPEMWAKIEARAAADGMDPIEWFDALIERFNTEVEGE